jgi:PAS domain S-box-containing protein
LAIGKYSHSFFLPKLFLVAVLFAGCLTFQILFYTGGESPLLMALYIVPILFTASFWGRLPGLISGTASTAAVGIVIAIIKPSALLQTMALCALFYIAIGAFVGRLFELMKIVRLKNRDLEQAIGRLAESEEKYTSLFENVPVGLYRTSPSGEILDANQAIVDLLGYPDKQTLLAVNVGSIYADSDHRNGFRERIDNAGTVRDFEARFRHYSGREIIAQISAHAIRDADGGILYYEGSLKDITDKRKAETQKQRTERLESVGYLAAGIAHDFNNILAGIRGFAEYLARKPKADANVAEAGKKIISATERAVSITDSLLMTLGSNLYDPRPARVADLVREARGNLGAAETAGIRVDFRIESGPAADGPLILADTALIAAAIRELISNAVSASYPGGVVVVQMGTGLVDRTMFFAHHGDFEGNYAWISISDEGHGMDEQTMERIFEPYFTTREFGYSAGFGMTRVYGIIRQHGGAIGIRSAPNRGTKVALYLPLVTQETD